jgi:hypothetical protein
MIELVRQVANMEEARQVKALLEREDTRIIQLCRQMEIFSSGNETPQQSEEDIET